DPALAGGCAWTEPEDLEQKLVELIGHMSGIIQKYLRNEFASIEEYNANAGEVSQPYRVLVAFDVPAGLTEAALQRLLAIMQAGPRCGVYCIVLLDPARALPEGMDRNLFRQFASTIVWDGTRFVWDDETFCGCALELDAPPDLAFSRRWDR